MKLKSLNLKQYRNYDSLNIDFNDKLNIIIGKNAQGKTNIIEAIYYLSITKSFLGVNDKNLINKDSVFSNIKGTIFDNNEEKVLNILINTEGKKIAVNDVVIKKHMDYLGNLKAIIFSPEDVRSLKDSPANRRRFLNIELSQLYSRYLLTLANFNILLKQRNEYLKKIKFEGLNREYLDILNDKFAELSSIIYSYRKKYINDLNKYISSIYFDISADNGLNIKYISDISSESDEEYKKSILLRLNNTLDKDIFYGSTSIGPHHDNFMFYLNDNNLSLYGSQGQFKMAILSLKLAEISVFDEILNDKPILLLDDIFGELDIEKRNRLIKSLDQNVQTFMTTTDLSEISEENLVDANIYMVENGRIIEKNINN